MVCGPRGQQHQVLGITDSRHHRHHTRLAEPAIAASGLHAAGARLHPRHFGPDLTAVLVAHNGFTCDFKWLIHTFERLRLALPPQVGGVCPG